MSARTPDCSGLLKWYPPGWRARYGDELVAMMEDSLEGRSPSRRLRVSVAWAGLRERGHELGLLGDSVPATDRLRAASLLVLYAWSAFVVADAIFAKAADNFDLAVPAPSHGVAMMSWYTVQSGALAGGLFVLGGAAIATPGFIALLRSGGWPSVRRPVQCAGAATAAAIVALAGLVALAHTVSRAQRNGGLLYHPVVGYYLAAFIATTLVLIAALAICTAAAVVVTRRIVLTERVVAIEAGLAVAVAVAMIVMTAATAAWWAAVGASVPWFIQGTSPGSQASAVDPNLVATMVLMVLASATACLGVVRVTRSWRHLRLG